MYDLCPLYGVQIICGSFYLKFELGLRRILMPDCCAFATLGAWLGRTAAGGVGEGRRPPFLPCFGALRASRGRFRDNHSRISIIGKIAGSVTRSDPLSLQGEWWRAWRQSVSLRDTDIPPHANKIR
jgi:hypothetical protein